jgi:hypothetical protein
MLNDINPGNISVDELGTKMGLIYFTYASSWPDEPLVNGIQRLCEFLDAWDLFYWHLALANNDNRWRNG